MMFFHYWPIIILETSFNFSGYISHNIVFHFPSLDNVKMLPSPSRYFYNSLNCMELWSWIGHLKIDAHSHTEHTHTHNWPPWILAPRSRSVHYDSARCHDDSRAFMCTMVACGTSWWWSQSPRVSWWTRPPRLAQSRAPTASDSARFRPASQSPPGPLQNLQQYNETIYYNREQWNNVNL